MGLGPAFWILILIWLAVYGFWAADWADRKSIGNSGFFFILLVLLGWKVFGAPLHS